MKLDALFFGAHPDDVEIFAGGTILKLKSMGYKVGICHLTRGEMGTYGTPEERSLEAQEAAGILGSDALDFLDIPDSRVSNTRENQIKVVEVIRKYQAEVIFTMNGAYRNPDHINTKSLVRDSAFFAGLEKFEAVGVPFRPSRVLYYYETGNTEKPDFVVNITPYFQQKIRAILAHKSQVIPEGDDDSGNKTLIKSNVFWSRLRERSQSTGFLVGVEYGEAFYSDAVVRLDDPVKAFTLGRFR